MIKKRGRPSKNEKAIREGKQKVIDSFFVNEKTIPIDEIIIEERKRSQINEETVDNLAESIDDLGLMNPITIDQNKKLVAGHHRILAFIKLGRKEIPYRMTTLTDPLKLELQEIDENLIREEVIYLEWCDLLVRRQEIYEEIHPETKHGGDRKSIDFKSKRQIGVLKNEEIHPETKATIGSELVKKRWHTNDKLSSVSKPFTGDIGDKNHFPYGDKLPFSSFTEDVGNKINKSQRTIERATRVARDILPELKKAIKTTKVANRKTDLRTVSEMEKDKQEELLNTILQMKKDNLKIENLKDIKNQIIFYKKDSESKEIKKMNEDLISKIDSVEDLLTRKIIKYEQKIADYLFSKENGLTPFDLWTQRLCSRNDPRWIKGRNYTNLFCRLKNLNFDVITGEYLNESVFTLHHQPYDWNHMLTRNAFPVNKDKHPKGSVPKLKGKVWDLFRGGFVENPIQKDSKKKSGKGVFD